MIAFVEAYVNEYNITVLVVIFDFFWRRFTNSKLPGIVITWYL